LGLACRLFGLSPEAAWTGFTANAAASLGRGRTRGRIGPGYRADLCVWQVPRAADIAYELDAHRPRHVVVGGRWAVRHGERVHVTHDTPETTPLFE
jgi:imidazolonepropionase